MFPLAQTIGQDRLPRRGQSNNGSEVSRLSVAIQTILWRTPSGLLLWAKNWLFAGSDEGGERAAILYSLIGTSRLNGLDPKAWLRYVISHIQDWPVNKVRDLLPWKVDLASV